MTPGLILTTNSTSRRLLSSRQIRRYYLLLEAGTTAREENTASWSARPAVGASSSSMLSTSSPNTTLTVLISTGSTPSAGRSTAQQGQPLTSKTLPSGSRSYTILLNLRECFSLLLSAPATRLWMKATTSQPWTNTSTMSA